MRLTTDLINSSLSYLNPLKERELDLRGHKIPAIENLGSAKDHDALDLTDNDIGHLANFPLMQRLKSLLLARNRIVTLAPALSKSIPNLTTLVLASNRITELADLDPLGGLTRLTHLVLLENPVTRKENYRSWAIWRCPSVRFLDYRKVSDAERKKAVELFGTATQPTSLAEKIAAVKTRASTNPVSADSSAPSRSTGGILPSSIDDPGAKIGRMNLTAKEKKRLEKMLASAKSLQEISQIEKELNDGKIPAGVRDGDGEDDEMGD